LKLQSKITHDKMKKLLFFGGILALGVVLAANMGGEEAKNPCERLKQLEPVSEMPTRYEVQEAEHQVTQNQSVKQDIGIQHDVSASVERDGECKREIIQ